MLALTTPRSPAADVLDQPRGPEDTTRGVPPPHHSFYAGAPLLGDPPPPPLRIRLAIRVEPARGPWADHCHAEQPRSYVIADHPWPHIVLAYASLMVLGLYLAAMALR